MLVDIEILPSKAYISEAEPLWWLLGGNIKGEGEESERGQNRQILA